MARTLIFGNSISYGFMDPKGGWAYKLRKDLQQIKDTNQVYNLSISGKRSDSTLERIEFETKHRLKKKDRQINSIIVSAGQNDPKILKSKIVVPFDEFKNNIFKIIAIAKDYTDNLIILGPIPVFEEKTTPVPWNKEEYYYNKNITKYNNALIEITKKEKIPFIEIFTAWYSKDYEKFLYDGLHPNRLGHKDIYKRLKKVFFKK